MSSLEKAGRATLFQLFRTSLHPSPRAAIAYYRDRDQRGNGRNGFLGNNASI